MFRHPLSIGANQVHTRGDEVLYRQFGQRQAAGRVVETIRVEGRAEQPNRAVGTTIGLQSFENFLAIVQHRSPRSHRQRPVSLQSVFAPALSVTPNRHRHVVGKFLAERQGIHDATVVGLGGGVRVGFQGETSRQLWGRGYRVGAELFQICCVHLDSSFCDFVSGHEVLLRVAEKAAFPGVSQSFAAMASPISLVERDSGCPASAAAERSAMSASTAACTLAPKSR